METNEWIYFFIFFIINVIGYIKCNIVTSLDIKKNLNNKRE